MVVLDTSIIIDHLRQAEGTDTKLLKVVRDEGVRNLAISVITVQELYQGESTREQEKEDFLLATLAPVRVLPYSWEIAKLAGELGRDSRQALELADAAIAATAITHAAVLYTLDTKDYKQIPDLELLD